jgi:serine/threonine protein kinase
MTGTAGPPALTGRHFGAYQLHELIGAGGMGEIYRATDSRLHRSIAIKVLPEALRLDADRVARLDQEARLLAALNRPRKAGRMTSRAAGRLAGAVAPCATQATATAPIRAYAVRRRR